MSWQANRLPAATTWRVYDEWGDQLEAGARYADAIGEYETVITTYPNATAEVQRAHNSEARVRFEYGTQLAAQGQYYPAIAQFETITAQFSDTAYAARAHTSAAQAYYAFAQPNLQGANCIAALSPYLTLASKYADTPEGAKAKAALAAGVDVTGAISNYPFGWGLAYLSRTTDGQNYFSDDYSSPLDGSARYAFHGVRPGDYNFSLIRPDGLRAWWGYTNPDMPYTITVGQLCAVHVDTYNFG